MLDQIDPLVVADVLTRVFFLSSVALGVYLTFIDDFKELFINQ